MTIALVPIGEKNHREVIGLDVHENQRTFVATNVYSIAQSYVFYPHFCPFGIYDGQTPVGFALYEVDPEDNKHWIHRLMIDKTQQGKGYGTEATRKLVALMQALPSYAGEILISFKPDNSGAEHIYAKVGFERTGEVLHGEVVMRYRG